MDTPKDGLKHVFLPTPENNHRPHVLRREAIITALSFLVLVEAFMLGANAFGLPLSQTASVLPAVLAQGTNSARVDDNLAPLSWNTKLAEAAQAKADDMAAKGYFAHVSPDGTTPWKWIADAGYQFEYAGENLAVDFTDSEDVVQAWLNSPTHRANILGEHYTDIGIGVATGMYKGKQSLFVVQEFGTPIPGVSETSVSAPAAGASATVAPETKTAQKTPTVAKTVAVSAPQPAKVLGAQTTASPVARAVAAPRSSTNYLFGGIAAFFALILIAALVFRKRLPPGAGTIGALSVVASGLALLLINNSVFSASVTLPLDTQSASVYQAIPGDIVPVAPEEAKG
jgi:hypothetical protein